MPLRIKISARAAREIAVAAQWWSENRPAAPGAVAKDVGESLGLLAEQPGIGSMYDGTRAQGVRGLFLARIGYRLLPRVPWLAGSARSLACESPETALAVVTPNPSLHPTRSGGLRQPAQAGPTLRPGSVLQRAQ